jgi:hypothetical protein
MICSLRAQIELGDYCPSPQLNYGAVIQHCLPPRILPLIGTEVVALHHQSLFGMTPQEAKQACSFWHQLFNNIYFNSYCLLK